MEGFLLVNKPAGVTSRHCVNHIFNVIKRSTGNKAKIGHAGTLDLFASGLLIVGIARIATREIDRIMTLNKTYHARARLGELTDTLDSTGTVLALEHTIHQNTIAALGAMAVNFDSEYLQMPPLYSALKYQGNRLSDLARSNYLSPEDLHQILRNKRRMVEIHNLIIDIGEAPFFTVQAHVSHGTYIRSLVDDIAQRIHMRATTHELVRRSIGPFSLNEAVPLSDILHIKDIEKKIVSVETMLQMIEQYQKR